MENKVKIEELLKRMLKKGDLNPNEISTFFGVPMEKIKECQEQLEKEAKVEVIVRKLLNKGYTSEEICLYVKNSIEKINREKTQLNKADIIKKEEAENKGSIKEHSEKRDKNKNININSNKKEETTKITNEDIDPNELLKHFNEIGHKLNDKTISSSTERMKLKNEQTIIANKYADAIIKMAENTNNLEELQRLSKEIPLQMAINNPLSIGRAKTMLYNNITKLKQNEYINNYRSFVPKEIEKVILNISNKNFNVANALKIIEQEANNRVEEKPKTKFALTKEQEVIQILNQIKTIILEKQAEQYPIKNPQVAIENLLKMTNNDFNFSLSTVIHNLINRKEFDTANKICDEYLKKYNYSEKHHNLYLICRSLKTEVISTEEKQKGKAQNIQGFSK